MTTLAYSAEVKLLMFEEHGCTYCEKWNDDIGEFYGNTKEGKWAKLERVDNDLPRDDTLKHIKGIVFTPTFVVISDNQEVGRITGHPGEDYFWGYLVNILKKTGFDSN
jgi:hypothetical protein